MVSVKDLCQTHVALKPLMPQENLKQHLPTLIKLHSSSACPVISSQITAWYNLTLSREYFTTALPQPQLIPQCKEVTWATCAQMAPQMHALGWVTHAVPRTSQRFQEWPCQIWIKSALTEPTLRTGRFRVWSQAVLKYLKRYIAFHLLPSWTQLHSPQYSLADYYS